MLRAPDVHLTGAAVNRKMSTAVQSAKMNEVSVSSKVKSTLLASLFFLALAGGFAVAQTAVAQTTSASPKDTHPAVWTFAVSGDSRNCGNVVMPAIANGVEKDHAAFYWHLGDLRAIYALDEDYKAEPEHRGQPVSKESYLKNAWPDFIQSQIVPFGSLPFFVGIGNHETIPPKTRQEFLTQFAQWLDSPALKKQRLGDNPKDTSPKTYFHWLQGGVDFIYLDNATRDQFGAAQLHWFHSVIRRAKHNPDVRAIVVGMHEALPDSLAADHSMNESPTGTSSGRQVYKDLLRFRRKSHKSVYVLASHSHFYMDGIYDTDYWRAHGGVLPGWIVGTAGAVRYALPKDAGRAKEAKQKVYGYLLGTVHPDGTIDFDFQEVKRTDIPEAVDLRFTPELVDYCFKKNTALK